MKITSILFIDTSVYNYETLLRGVAGSIKAVVLDSNRDGVAQITDVLSQYREVQSVHIVSHGSPGTLYLGNSELSLNTLELYADQLKNCFCLSSHLLLYGCQVAAGDAGTEFLTKLHQLTKASISASANLTGNAALGGDWDLEVNIGNISNQSLAFSTEVITAYQSVLNVIAKGSESTSSYAFGVAVKGNYAYVAATAAGLQIFDISDPDDPKFTGNATIPGSAYDTAVDDQYAYVADFDTGFLEIYDITNPGSPTSIGRYDTGSGRAYDVYVKENIAYVTSYKPGESADSYDQELQIVDISDRSNPVFIGSYNLDGYGLGVTVNDKYAYVAARDAGLQILDISNSANPVLVGSYNNEIKDAKDVAIQDKYAYVTDGSNGLRIIDVSDPTNPILQATYATSTYASNIAVEGKYAYVTDYTSGLRILDISDPTTPNLVDTYADTSNPNYAADGVAVKGRYVYVAYGDKGLQILENNAANTAPVLNDTDVILAAVKADAGEPSG
ncbi:MAG: DUF4347 domain-containing protein, partial [Scytonema sp. PMC 1069.18]|nr:DUF4347 domain-containing protein [Scytonema sp. PMC 1069.18]